MSNPPVEFNYNFPKSHYSFTKRHLPRINSVKLRVKQGSLPGTILIDFRAILKKYYPELDVKEARQLKKKEREVLKKHDFTINSFTLLINNTRHVYFYDVHKFISILSPRVKLVLTISEDILKSEMVDINFSAILSEWYPELLAKKATQLQKKERVIIQKSGFLLSHFIQLINGEINPNMFDIQKFILLLSHKVHLSISLTQRPIINFHSSEEE